jgi:hypothetical protein
MSVGGIREYSRHRRTHQQLLSGGNLNRMSWAAAEARIKYQNIDNEVVFPIMSIFYSFKSLSASMMYHLLSYIK